VGAVVANVDFGHTDPLVTVTLPIGGTVEVLATRDAGARIRITRHQPAGAPAISR
jgi:hypothetical protein